MTGARLIRRVALALLAAVVVLAGLVVSLNAHEEDAPAASAEAMALTPAERVARGAYLAKAGNCETCHTARGGAPYAGGRAIDTPFGAVYSSNLTPDAQTGLGAWSADDFWRALHHGRSRDGRLLYPAFPYPNYTRVTRDDALALQSFLRSLVPVAQPNRPHALRFPYDTQAALAIWRALYFRPATFEADASRDAEWNRGAYLVQGLGHCNACHASRNLLGATPNPLDLGGGLIPMQNWYAPSLASPHEAGVAQTPPAEVVTLLRTGVTPNAVVSGPMAEVVARSTQHLNDGDLRAMASYLRALPASAAPTPDGVASTVPPPLGAKLYGDHCAACHGDEGQGAPTAYPRLAGNRAVMLDPPANLVRVIVGGGFAPATAANPRPYGMPPFATELSDAEIAAVATHIRNAWGNRGAALTALDVARFRGP